VEVFKSIQLKNILSYGEEGVDLPLRSLNVLIGPNGAGKSNLLDVFGLLQALSSDPAKYIRESGGVSQWGWKREASPSKEMRVKVSLRGAEGEGGYDYELQFENVNGMFAIARETCSSWRQEGVEGNFYLDALRHEVRLGRPGDSSELVSRDRYVASESVLKQRVGGKYYQELLDVEERFSKVHVYRGWPAGQAFLARRAQALDLPDRFLLEDASNLAMVLLRVYNNPELRLDFLEYVRDVYEDVTDFGVEQLGAGTGQVYLLEGKRLIPSSRLSDGTLRYLCLLAALLDPPADVICLEEPEAGLHPDLLHKLAQLLRRASEKAQLVVTTHSTVLVDALSDAPEAVVVCEKQGGQSSLRRLSGVELGPWLEKYSLGSLWSQGHLGGNRW
jgi:predicted ATPase